MTRVFSWAPVALALVACQAGQPAAPRAPQTPVATAPPVEAPLPAPSIPTSPQAFRPAFVEVVASAQNPAMELMAPESCAPCHPQQAAQWPGSAHALSSFSNPLYRQAFDAFVDTRGRDKAPFCGGCHDPALLLAGTLTEPTDPDDAKAHAGIGCGLCHGVVSATSEGNGSYRWSAEPIPLPTEGDAPSLAAHIQRVSAPRALGDTLCSSCHRALLTADVDHPVTLFGMDEVGGWRDSAWGGNEADRVDTVAPQGCIDCHMPAQAEGHSHRFPGGHTTLAAMIGSHAQAEAIAGVMKGAARLAVVPLMQTPEGFRAAEAGAGGLKGDDAQPAPLLFDVVTINEGVGHRFPGGALDLRDSYLTVEVIAADGTKLATAGGAHARSGEDPSAHRLRALVADSAGQPVMNHAVAHVRVPVFNHTIPPRGAAVARFEWSPEAPIPLGQWPLTINATLNHRRIHLPFADGACNQSQSAKGQAFAAGAKAHLGLTVDGCATQPITPMATASAALSPNGPASPLSASDLFDHGRGLTAQVQERLGEAQRSLERALAQTDPTDTHAQTAIIVELARVTGRMGRTDEALSLLARAQALTPEHPAVYAASGEALSRVWRWPEAQEAWQKAATLAPGDAHLWAQLAIAAGSARQPRVALEAAKRGLSLEPRSASLLRSQMLAYVALARGSEEASVATAAWEAHRRDEQAATIKSRCSNGSDSCLRGRAPVPVYRLQ